MKKIVTALLLLSALAGALALSAAAADAPAGTNHGQPPALNHPQDPYHQQMAGFMNELKNAKTPEQRKEIQGKMNQARQAYRAAHPVKELTSAEKAARQQKMEEMLKKDTYRWELYQLKQSMAKAKTPQERESYQVKIKDLMARHAAEQEAKLTPEQRSAAQARKEKNTLLQAELKPLNAQMRAAKTPEERKAIHVRMAEIVKKYR
ncbi:MAG: hypothetical protein NTX59_04820 [Elusimicrobia bacterium]|nr:hypothetical protein [Elusimicrobiota bacterium]